MAAMEFMMDDVPMMDENPSASAELKSAPMPLVGFLPVVTQSPTACQAVAISLP